MILVLSFVLGAGLSFCSPAYSSDTSIEFCLLERLRSLRENPNGPQAREDLFALGEYYYQQNSYSAAAQYFSQYNPKDLKSSGDLIAVAYLTLCYLKENDPARSSLWRKKMEEAAFSKPYFSLKTGSRLWSWESPLKNQFECREGADRVEIFQNGKTFYALDVS